MSQTGVQIAVVALATANFAEALAQNVSSAMYNIQMPTGIGGPGRRSVIRAIQAITDENFGPEFNFFESAAGVSGNPDTDTFLGRFGFTSPMGEQLGGSGSTLWRYYVDGLAIPYFDQGDTTNPGSAPQSLHVILQNISATAKLIRGGSSGRCHATFWLEFATAW